MNNNYSFNYGISIAFSTETTKLVITHLDNSMFKVAQVTSLVARSQAFQKIRFSSVDICNLFSRSFTNVIFEQSERIIDSFVSKFAEFTCQKEEYMYQSLTLDIELGMDKNNHLYQNYIKVLKRLGAKLHEKDITLCFPVRIPYATNDTSKQSLTTLREIISPNCQFCVDIHPHELPPNYSVDDLMRWYQFYTKSIRFIYEPEIGNNLVVANIKPWLEYLKKRCFSGNIFFAPVISTEERFCEEIAHLQDIVSKVQEIN